MSQTFLSPDRLYDRPWRPGHPLHRNPSAKRRWTMLLLFGLLCALIGGYLYITDPKRVQRMAETELSKLIKGHVTVGRAKLSLFEGLRLEYVNVYVDASGDSDALLFSANQFLVNYDLKSLLAGRLKLTQLVAIDPTVQLIENLDSGKWNYQRMMPSSQPSGEPARGGPLPALPQVILRNAQIEYVETIGGQPVSKGTMAIEGQLAPSSDGQVYTFELQSRGGSVASSQQPAPGAIGPTVQGTLRRDTGEVIASLRDFKFGQDVRSMLPAQVRAWWDRHSLAGAVDVPVLSFTPAGPDTEQKYRVETLFRDVNLTIRPEEWMSRDEVITHAWAKDAFDAMRGAGLNNNGVVDRIAALVQPSLINLDGVTGGFEFTESGIVLKGVKGKLEDNEFLIDGKIDGYSPLSPARIQVRSERTAIPAQPTYITSMPRQVRELYDHLRPQGICTLQVDVDRPSFGGRLEVAGAIDILDGNFVFDKFPYPVRAATGRIVFGYDPHSGMDQVKLVNLRGRGVRGGPNANSLIKLEGAIGPLTGDAGVYVQVSCDSVRDEPALKAAFPEEVRKALANMDADGRGVYPKFHGGFVCRVTRPIGPHSPWIIETDVDLKTAAGKFVAFPYLMENVTGRLEIREGYIDIKNASMTKRGSSLAIDGRVTWRAGLGGRALEPGEVQDQVTPARPDLKITARNVPIDKDLLAALPGDRRAWLEKVGLTGTLDIDGRVWWPSHAERPIVARSETDSELTHAFDLALRDATIWPVDGAFSISKLNGQLRLLPDRLVISQITGKREAADLTGRGEISWPQNNPSIYVSGTASKLDLDRSLYRVLPDAAKKAWDAVNPEGTVNLDLTYKGGVTGEDRVSGVGLRVSGEKAQSPTTQLASASPEPRNPKPETRSSPLDNLDLIIHPVKLSATVDAFPYKLTDIQGTVRLSRGRISLADLSGKHGAGTIRVSGSGSAENTDWDLRVSGERIVVDDELRRALPSGMQTVVDGIKLTGAVGFDFPRLQVRETPAQNRVARPRPASTTAPDATPLDVDFTVRMAMDGSTMDVGVPMVDVDGRLELEGSVRDSRLAALSGAIDLPSLALADREAEDVHAEFFKPDDQDALRIGNITGRVAGGNISGHVDLAFPEVGPSRYVMSLVLRNADLRDLSGDLQTDLSGRLSASLDLQGDWTDTRSRRGRGHVGVSGKEMYKIPLVLGLLQITNLSLPITTPFNEGEATYMVDGETLTVESLRLRSRDMVMSGAGQLDFATRKVAMTFTTDNPNWPKLPIVGDLIHTAKNELLQIHVKGTLQEPKISASPTHTVTTTVDEVLRGDASK